VNYSRSLTGKIEHVDFYQMRRTPCVAFVRIYQTLFRRFKRTTPNLY